MGFTISGRVIVNGLFIASPYRGPIITASGTVNYTSGGSAVILDASLTVSDPSSGTLIGGIVSITSGFLADDMLNFINQNGISGSYNSGTGVLTLTGNSTLANYQTALQSITYSFSGTDATNGGTDNSRTISWKVNDPLTVSNTGISMVDTFPPSPGAGLALFGAGGSGSTYISNTSIYVYSTNATTLGTSLGVARYLLAATSNTTTGIFGGGNASSSPTSKNTDIYTFSNNTVNSGTILASGLEGLAAAGNSTLAVFGGGHNSGGSQVATIQTWSYSGSFTISGHSLSAAAWFLAAAGNSTDGFFAGGTTSSSSPFDTGQIANVTDYNYSGGTATAATSLSTAVTGLSACGTPTAGYFGGGVQGSEAITANVYQYTYSNESTAVSGSLRAAKWLTAAASNNITGIFGGGVTTVAGASTATTDTYTFSTNGDVSGTALPTATQQPAACSSNPGF
jgi:hypothetical protein